MYTCECHNCTGGARLFPFPFCIPEYVYCCCDEVVRYINPFLRVMK